jgi:hypothetical protein
MSASPEGKGILGSFCANGAIGCCYRGRIDDVALDPFILQHPMNPKAVGVSSGRPKVRECRIERGAPEFDSRSASVR